ncbi:MAG: glycosyltransferase family 39 protein [Kofleriaceae bacterium]
MTTRRLLNAAFLGWFVVGFLALVSGPPLGHDEAAYAVAARGDAPTWHYRSTGMITIARAGLLVGDSPMALRMVALLLSGSLLIGAFLLGRAAFDERTGAWAALVITTSHQMMARSAELIGDLPSTGALLIGCAFLIANFQRDRSKWSLVAAAPLFAAAFYIRYGSGPVIAIITLLTIILYPRKLLQAPVLVTALVFLGLLVPHVHHSISTTGKLFGILEASASMPKSHYLGQGLVAYVTANPFTYYGALIFPLMIAGLVGVRRNLTRPKLFVILLALGQIIALGLQTYPQPRYIFFATALLAIAGVDTLRRYDLPRAALVVIGLAWLGIAIGIVPFQRSLTEVRTPLYAAAEAIRIDDHGRPCAIAANVAPQLIWITRCQVVVAKTLPKVADPWPHEAERYIVSVPHALLPTALLDQIAPARRPLPVGSPDAQAWHY